MMATSCFNAVLDAHAVLEGGNAGVCYAFIKAAAIIFHASTCLLPYLAIKLAGRGAAFITPHATRPK